jgi:hypothetical protein
MICRAMSLSGAGTGMMIILQDLRQITEALGAALPGFIALAATSTLPNICKLAIGNLVILPSGPST